MRSRKGARVAPFRLSGETLAMPTDDNTQGTLPGFDAPKPLTFTIVFDGGSLGNPGKGYGSFEITRDGEIYHFVDRMEFGNNLTNNQAEYMALIEALKWLAKDLGERRKDAKVSIFGDSKLVVNQVNGTWKVKNANMVPLVKQAKELFPQFGTCTIEWHPRAESVQRLGH
jgi:ribonuclease HI